MVSIYSLRPVYTFLYKIINGNVRASFVQTKKSFEILWSKKNFFAYVRNLEIPPPPLYAMVRIWLDPSPPPLCVRTMWMTPKLDDLDMCGTTKFIIVKIKVTLVSSETGRVQIYY